MSVLVREPEPKDLVHVTRYAIDWAKLVDEQMGEPQRTEQLRERKDWAAEHLFNDQADRRLFVAEMAGRMIGYIFGTLEDTEGWIREIYVEEFYRREGIGTQLMASMRSWMESQNIQSIHAEVPGSYGREFFQTFNHIKIHTAK
ncbi:GNAT family N-acetyltransferase [Halobacillus massiliensis]|uniref:GNAT family N-acetyltransferase n=1 Tax=Halobacillus massiliensis TaxID=1926286 RepID=UPI0009E1A48F|nr:GNAT family N-acetyltransferase [Halobacillus massiliensis]